MNELPLQSKAFSAWSVTDDKPESKTSLTSVLPATRWTSVLISDTLLPQHSFKSSIPSAVKNIRWHISTSTSPYSLHEHDSLMIPSFATLIKGTTNPKTSKPQNPQTLRTDHIRCLPQMLGQLPCSRAACGLFGAYFNVCLRDHGTGQTLHSLSSKYLPIIYSFTLPGWLLPPSSEDPCRLSLKHTHA